MPDRSGAWDIPGILDAYRLKPDWNYQKIWTCGTPDSIIGETVLLAQATQFPRVAHSADLRGNAQDEGRRCVSLSRSRSMTSFHASDECFTAGDIPPAWRKHVEAVEPGIKHVVKVKPGHAPLAPVRTHLATDINEEAAFALLLQNLSDLPKFIEQVHEKNPTLRKSHQQPANDTMWEAMLAVADGYLQEIVEEKQRDRADSNDDGDTSSAGDREENTKILEAAPLGDYHPVVQQSLTCVALLPHLLTTVSYVFSERSAQVVPLILHRTAGNHSATLKDIVSFQRLILYLLARVYSKDLARGAILRTQVVPHKSRVFAGHIVKECWSSRDALVLCAESADESKPLDTLAYSYLGGGVTWDPPFGYGIVSKRLPLHVADRLLAVVLFVSGGDPRANCFVRRVDWASAKCQPRAEMEEEIAERMRSVTFYLKELRHTFKSFPRLLQFCNLQVSEDTDVVLRDVAVAELSATESMEEDL